MTEQFIMAAVVTPLMLLATAGIVAYFGLRSNTIERQRARERGEIIPPP